MGGRRLGGPGAWVTPPAGLWERVRSRLNPLPRKRTVRLVFVAGSIIRA
ncbi:hypothetical protein ppKF707_4920 [Metapseudomonas furukawaii]|uniref:Uncharacterized protein n=1 Tax=Metapseudomonas furukawaii TaxID=1149133 RepID=A0AAD1C1Q5_METFU|nr:hypothetical protein ppKF707_4920 [Pseudomonas furukawaii]BAU74512.1 hypothetical protein KF707C_28240 [Pseudomonas furukawaii]